MIYLREMGDSFEVFPPLKSLQRAPKDPGFAPKVQAALRRNYHKCLRNVAVKGGMDQR